MQYLRIPRTITSTDVLEQKLSWSPSMYRRIEMPAQKTKTVGELLHGWDKGTDPGSIFYLRQSTNYLIRTKALKSHSTLIYPKGDAITPLSPRAFESPNLADGDILLSKDSNIGECAMVDGDRWTTHAISGGIVRLRPKIDRFYLFAFLKHQVFREELYAMVPRGATIAHANTLWLNCKIPFPDQLDAARVERYVAALMEAIVDKERTIRERNDEINRRFEQELATFSNGSTFVYEYPTRTEVLATRRLDAAIYSKPFKIAMHRIKSYRHGWASYKNLGFSIARGQNLQVSCIGQSVYSEKFKADFYHLIAPTDISEYRTVKSYRYLGNKRELDLVKKGDVIFGAEGFGKGRSLILVDDVQRTISNIHGVIFHPTDGCMTRGIFFGCFLGYLRRIGIVDAIGAGGSGGSLAIGYLDQVPFPRLPDDTQARIAKLYHSPALPPTPQRLIDFVSYHRSRNASLGIWELDNEMKALQADLAAVQDLIIQGKSVKVPLPD